MTPRLLLAALMLLLLVPGLTAQSDPRDTEDPRTAADPREFPDPRFVTDPREVLQDPREIEDPREAAIAEKERELFSDLSGRELFDALYDQGTLSELAVVMGAEPWQLLPYIDSLCESWLAMVEQGLADDPQGAADMEALQAKARQLADLADGVLLDSRFTIYVDNFFGWTPEEQVEFRAGQDQYQRAVSVARAATDADDAQQALQPASASYATARALGDTWGQTMSLAFMARIQQAGNLHAEARQTSRDAIRIGHQIRALDDVWAALGVVYGTSLELDDELAARQALIDQQTIALQVGDQETADAIADRMIDLATYYYSGAPGLSAPNRGLGPQAPRVTPRTQGVVPNPDNPIDNP